MYGAETWFVSNVIKRKMQIFINRCLRNILKIWWPKVISNEDLWRITDQKNINNEIKKRKYGWLEHSLRKEYEEIPHAVLEWNPQGSRRRGRQRTSWRRSVNCETGKLLQELRVMARNRDGWKFFVETLSS